MLLYIVKAFFILYIFLMPLCFYIPYRFFNAIYEKALHRFGVFAVATYKSPSPRRFCVALAIAERVKAFRLAFACVLRFA